MTHDQFHARLLKLILYAHRDGLCPGCVLQELLAAGEAIVANVHLSADDLDAHGIDNVVVAPVTRDTVTPSATRH